MAYRPLPKYAPLVAYREAQGTPQVSMRVTDMRNRLGIDLPVSAHTSTWWRDGRQAHGTRVWPRAGWRVVDHTRAGSMAAHGALEHGLAVAARLGLDTAEDEQGCRRRCGAHTATPSDR
jgi:hypothetical protein